MVFTSCLFYSQIDKHTTSCSLHRIVITSFTKFLSKKARHVSQPLLPFTDFHHFSPKSEFFQKFHSNKNIRHNILLPWTLLPDKISVWSMTLESRYLSYDLDSKEESKLKKKKITSFSSFLFSFSELYPLPPSSSSSSFSFLKQRDHPGRTWWIFAIPSPPRTFMRLHIPHLIIQLGNSRWLGFLQLFREFFIHPTCAPLFTLSPTSSSSSYFSYLIHSGHK